MRLLAEQKKEKFSEAIPVFDGSPIAALPLYGVPVHGLQKLEQECRGAAALNRSPAFLRPGSLPLPRLSFLSLSLLVHPIAP